MVDRFDRYVYAITRAFRFSAEDSEDVFQEVFARTYEHLEAIRDDAAIRPWIGQLTRRLCVDRWRALAHETPSESVDVPGLDMALARVEEALDVRAALLTLPEHCQQILDRFFARDHSYREIEEALELPAGTIASRISRCVAKLRRALEGRDRPGEPSSD